MYQKELQLAIQVVKRSANTFKKYFGTKTKVRKKEGNYRNLVSYADKKIEQDIKKFLIKKFPNFGFIGEESGSYNPQAKSVWALDPIDGTTNYLQGLPYCALSLGLLHKEKPIVGVVYAPLLNRIYTARLGNGAALNNKKILVSKIQKTDESVGTIGWGPEIDFAVKTIPKFLPRIRKFRVFGSSAINLCHVAEGSLDFYLAGHMNIWDYAAGQIILEEAGGVLLTSKSPRSLIAANPYLAKKILKLF